MEKCVGKIMRIYLCDHTYNECQEDECVWYVALRTAFGGRFAATETQGIDAPPSRHCGYDDPSAVLFVHSQEGEEQWRQKANEHTTQCHVDRKSVV